MPKTPLATLLEVENKHLEDVFRVTMTSQPAVLAAALVKRFNYNLTRQRLINGLELAMTHFKAVGCRKIYINGSFVSSKPKPGDFDACWEENGVDINEKLLSVKT